MDGAPNLKKLFEYNAAANRRTLGSLPINGSEHERAYKVIGHAVNVERLWLNRLEHGEKAKAPEMFPILTKNELEETIDENSMDFSRILAGMGSDGLSRIVDYVTTEGDQKQSAAGDILFHVINHSTYHRGQVALLLGSGGGHAAVTDYIAFARGDF
ncbi:MAG: DinB family protein [Nitrospinae bacterium]|nr:DinB family protein [Nitrospinota bacterium]